MATKKGRGILALVLVTSLLGACSGSPTGEEATTRPGAGTAAPSSASATPQPEPVTITLWETSEVRDDFYIQKEKEFLDTHPHITLNKVIREGNPGNEFYQAVAAGNAPDMVLVSFAMIDRYMRAGILEPLNDYFAEWEESDQFIQEFLNFYTRDGNLYGIPFSVAPMLFGYNKKLFNQAGLTEPPATWEEALEAAKLIADPANQIAGYATLTAEWTEWFFQYYVWQAGGDLTKENADGTIELTFTDPPVIEAAKYYQSLRAANVLQADITLKFNDLIESFARGQVGMMPYAADWVSRAVNLGMAPDDIGLALPPAGPDGSQATAISGSGWTINAGTSQAKKDAAWEYIKFYSSYEYRVQGLENSRSKGANNPMVSTRHDINIVEHLDLPDDYRAVLEGVNTVGRLEFYGKSQFGIYVDRAVQRILTEPHVDPLIELQNAQNLATSEALEEFNSSIMN